MAGDALLNTSMRFYLWRQLPPWNSKFNLFAVAIDAINIAKCARDKRRRADLGDRPVDGISDSDICGNQEDALALIRRDAPMLTDFTRNLLNAPLLDKQAEWCGSV